MKEFRLQANPTAQAKFRRAMEQFGDQENSTKQISKNLDQLYHQSHKLRQKSEITKQIMQHSVPRTTSALKNSTT